MLTIEDLECLVWNFFNGFDDTVSSVTICTIIIIRPIAQHGRFITTDHISLLVLASPCFCDKTLYPQEDDHIVFDRILFVLEIPDYAESSAAVQLQRQLSKSVSEIREGKVRGIHQVAIYTLG